MYLLYLLLVLVDDVRRNKRGKCFHSYFSHALTQIIGQLDFIRAFTVRLVRRAVDSELVIDVIHVNP